jgi:glycoprotein-N-acetylgalactosamine 3-beta-galactosyltransferase
MLIFAVLGACALKLLTTFVTGPLNSFLQVSSQTGITSKNMKNRAEIVDSKLSTSNKILHMAGAKGSLDSNVTILDNILSVENDTEILHSNVTTLNSVLFDQASGAVNTTTDNATKILHSNVTTLNSVKFDQNATVNTTDNGTEIPDSTATLMNSVLFDQNATVNTTTHVRAHPHAGAVDEEGNYGYVHDPTVIANSKIQFSIPPKEITQVCAPAGAGPEGIGGYRLITEKILVANVEPRLKIFCSIYTSPENEEMRWAIAETWGGHCDGYLAATTYTDSEFGTVNVLHEGEETYHNIWQKVRSIWAYVHDNFLDSYDFFHINGDDTFVIVENMRSFLQSKKVEQDAGGPSYPRPLYIGFPVGSKSKYFNGGGSGYTLNKAALKLLVQEAFPVCEPFRVDSAEDILIADCFRRFNVTGYSTLDADGELRYNNDPNFIYNLNFSDPSFMNGNLPANFLFERTHKDWPLKPGLEGASNETVTFHHIKPPAKIRRIYKLLYRQNIADCSPDGKNEPGKIMPNEYYAALPHNNCTWGYNLGHYRSCPFKLYTEYTAM